MKLHFEPNLDYQLLAIEAVCDLFRGRRSAEQSSLSSNTLLAARGYSGLPKATAAQATV